MSGLRTETTEEQNRREVLAERVEAMRLCDTGSSYDTLALNVASYLTPGEVEQLGQLLEQGPTWDGDVVSKSHRDFLLKVGLACRVAYRGEQGHTACTYSGQAVYRYAKPIDDIRKSIRGQARAVRLEDGEEAID